MLTYTNFIFHLKNYFILTIFIILVAACSSKPPIYTLEPITSCNFPDNPTETAPLWVCNLDVEGYPITGVGSTASSKAGIQFMTQQAAAQARVAIAQELKTRVRNRITTYMESKHLADEETINTLATSVTEQITDAILVGSKILRVSSSSNGILYVLVGLTPQSYKETLTNAFNKANPQVRGVLNSEEYGSMSQSIINQNP